MSEDVTTFRKKNYASQHADARKVQDQLEALGYNLSNIQEEKQYNRQILRGILREELKNKINKLNPEYDDTKLGDIYKNLTKQDSESLKKILTEELKNKINKLNPEYDDTKLNNMHSDYKSQIANQRGGGFNIKIQEAYFFLDIYNKLQEEQQNKEKKSKKFIIRNTTLINPKDKQTKINEVTFANTEKDIKPEDIKPEVYNESGDKNTVVVRETSPIPIPQPSFFIRVSKQLKAAAGKVADKVKTGAEKTGNNLTAGAKAVGNGFKNFTKKVTSVFIRKNKYKIAPYQDLTQRVNLGSSTPKTNSNDTIIKAQEREEIKIVTSNKRKFFSNNNAEQTQQTNLNLSTSVNQNNLKFTIKKKSENTKTEQQNSTDPISENYKANGINITGEDVSSKGSTQKLNPFVNTNRLDLNQGVYDKSKPQITQQQRLEMLTEEKVTKNTDDRPNRQNKIEAKGIIGHPQQEERPLKESQAATIDGVVVKPGKKKETIEDQLVSFNTPDDKQFKQLEFIKNVVGQYKEEQESGSTVTTASLDAKGNLKFACLGDSPVYLVLKNSNGEDKVIQLSEDMDANSDRYVDLIQKLGGTLGGTGRLLINPNDVSEGGLQTFGAIGDGIIKKGLIQAPEYYDFSRGTEHANKLNNLLRNVLGIEEPDINKLLTVGDAKIILGSDALAPAKTHVNLLDYKIVLKKLENGTKIDANADKLPETEIDFTEVKSKPRVIALQNPIILMANGKDICNNEHVNSTSDDLVLAPLPPEKTIVVLDGHGGTDVSHAVANYCSQQENLKKYIVERQEKTEQQQQNTQASTKYYWTPEINKGEYADKLKQYNESESESINGEGIVSIVDKENKIFIKYQGNFSSGLLNGYGFAQTEYLNKANNVKTRTYEGKFQNGKFDGAGIITTEYQDKNIIKEEVFHSNGIKQKTNPELFKGVSKDSEVMKNTQELQKTKQILENAKEKEIQLTAPKNNLLQFRKTTKIT